MRATTKQQSQNGKLLQVLLMLEASEVRIMYQIKRKTEERTNIGRYFIFSAFRIHYDDTRQSYVSSM